MQSSDLTPYNEQVLPPAPGGMGGGGLGGAMPSPSANMPADSLALSAVDEAPKTEMSAHTDPFGAPTAMEPAAEPLAPPMVNVEDGDVFSADPNVAGRGTFSKPQKGSARLSVNVNLDVPSDYQAREFVSVADAVHQPSVLSLVVQRRGQIGAIRLVAALIVILLAWRMRNAPLLWKLTVATTLFLAAIGLLPLLSNAWQSLLDGVALGALVSVGMALGCLCCSWCTCGLTKLKRSTMFGNLKVAQSNVSK